MSARRNIGGRVAAFAAAALVVLMTAGVVLADSTRTRMTSPQVFSGSATGVPGDTCSGVGCVIEQVGTGAISSSLRVGNTATNLGGVILSYSDSASINAIEFRKPGSATLHGYFYPDATLSTLVTGVFKSESPKVRGTITLSAGTGTATVLSGAVCVCTDTTANASVKCAVATTTLTATGTGTDVIAYHCL